MIPVWPPEIPRTIPITFAQNQPEYEPLPARLDIHQGRVITEWELSAEELARILAGGRIRLTVLTFGAPPQPLLLEIP